MLSSNSVKVFFIAVLFLTLFSACRWWQKAENNPASPTPFAVEEVKSGIPFSTKEPENFQAEFIVTTEGKEDKTFAVRGLDNSRRYDYHYGQKNQISVLQTADNKTFLIFNNKKIYTENISNRLVEASENPFDFLTTEWLNQKADAKFEFLGTENNFLKYRVILDNNQTSESFIWVDKNIGLPVKQEFYSVNGEQKILNFTFEIKNFKPQADANLFEIPKDFRKVSVEEFRKVLQGEV